MIWGGIRCSAGDRRKRFGRRDFGCAVFLLRGTSKGKRDCNTEVTEVGTQRSQRKIKANRRVRREEKQDCNPGPGLGIVVEGLRPESLSYRARDDQAEEAG